MPEKQKKILISKISPNSKYNKALTTKKGNVIIEPFTTITENILKLLIDWNFDYLYTKGTEEFTQGIDLHKISGFDEEFIIEYKKFIINKEKFKSEHRISKNLLKSLLLSIPIKKSIDYSKLKKLAEMYISKISYNKNIYLYLFNMDTKNDFIFFHSINVMILCIILATAIKMDFMIIKNIAIGALLHDLGMLLMDKDILEGKKDLTASQYALIKQHPVKAYKLLKNVKEISPISLNIILYHHERYNGTGYPDGLKKDKMSDEISISALSDFYEALIQNRVYRYKFTPFGAMQIILKNKELFSPKILNAFIKEMSIFPIGTFVKLSNGAIGIVIKSNRDDIKQPLVRLLIDKYKKPIKKYQILDLMNSEETIKEIINTKDDLILDYI